jgi:uncharacterized membrane protein YkoI
MKRTLTVVLSLGLVLMLSGAPAMAETNTAPLATASFVMPTISFDEAITLAKAAAPGHELMALSLEDENGVLVYQAMLINQTDKTMIEIKLDSTTGMIITETAASENVVENDSEADNEQNGGDNNVEYVGSDDVLGQNENETDNEQNGDESNVEYVGNDDGLGQNENEAAVEQESKTTDDAADAALLAKAVVTLTQAADIVLTANTTAVITGIQLEDENGMPVYSVALIDANGLQVAVRVDAVSGAILPDDNQTAEN